MGSVLQIAGTSIRLDEELAHGGMGRIWLASRAGGMGFTRRVVVKQMLRPTTTDQVRLQRFQREAALIARLKHPHIVEVIDFDEVDGVYYMVLEYIRGVDLSVVLRLQQTPDQAIPIGVALTIGAAIADALAYAHDFVDASGLRHRIVHRDVTPENILIGHNDEIKLIDFGIAKDLDMAGLTDDGDIIGKPLYLPPECLRGGDPSPAWDIYSLGVTLYRMLAGRMPFLVDDVNASLLGMANAVATQVPAPVHHHNPSVPAALSEVIAHAIAKDPRQRYSAAASLQRDLLAVRRTLPLSETRDPRVLLGEEVTTAGGVEAVDSALAELVPAPPATTWSVPQPVVDSTIRPEPGDVEAATGSTEWSVERTAHRWAPALMVAVGLAVAGLITFLLLYPSSVPEPEPRLTVVEPTPAPGVMPGRIIVKCGSWGYVHVDGQIIGPCPVKPVTASAGPHTVAFKDRKGARQREVVIRPGEDLVVDFRAGARSIEVTVPVWDSP